MAQQPTGAIDGDGAAPGGEPTLSRHSSGAVATPRSQQGLLTGIAYRYALLLLLGIEVAIFALVEPAQFLTTAEFQNVLSSQAIDMIVTLGLTIPMLAGEFDVSVAYTLGLSMVLAGVLTVNEHWALAPALLACVAAGAVIGLVNSLVVVRLGVNSFVATLGSGTAILGLTTLVSNSQLIAGLPQALVSSATGKLVGLPLPVFYGLALAALLWFIYDHTTVGRRLLFVGAGAQVARLAGVRVARIRTGAFIASGILAAVAGLVLAGQLSASDPSAGPNYLLPAFAGAFLGATTVKPGRANAWGTVIALYFLTVGVTGLQLLGAGSWVQDVFNGVALVVGVGVTRLIGRRVGGQSSLSE